MHWDPKTIQRFDVHGPRYTSYPTAMQFHEEIARNDFSSAIGRSNTKNRPLSLYFHIPFCKQLCYYCACHKEVTNNAERVRSYLDALKKEITLIGDMCPKNRPVIQLHFGGGTPTFLDNAQLTELMYHISQHFHLLDDDRGDYSIEIDPRDADVERLALLRGLGFNRVSLGVQDFDPKVQKAINRVQPYDLVAKVMESVVDFKFSSVNMDLIYGLPFQTEIGFARTIKQVIGLSPDRLSLFNYAHLPMRFKAQAQFLEETLPGAREKLNIFSNSAEAFLKAGYSYIGMDHFAKPNDKLAIAQKEGHLHRNFQGYTIHGEADLLGFGASAISQVDNIYSQNVKSITDYQALLEEDLTPLERGVELSADDEKRRWVIGQVICHNCLVFNDYYKQFGEYFIDCFPQEMLELEAAKVDELLELDSEGFQLSDKGRLVVRRICMIFDEYNAVDKNSVERRFSRII